MGTIGDWVDSETPHDIIVIRTIPAHAVHCDIGVNGASGGALVSSFMARKYLNPSPFPP